MDSGSSARITLGAAGSGGGVGGKAATVSVRTGVALGAEATFWAGVGLGAEVTFWAGVTLSAGPALRAAASGCATSLLREETTAL
jgi:hypothetical protein